MRLRSFTAPDMPAAMRMVREALGDGAIILASESNKGRKGVTVTAAVDPEDEDSSHREAGKEARLPSSAHHRPHPNPPPNGEGMRNPNRESEDIRFELREILRFHNLPEIFIAKIMQKTGDREISGLQLPRALEKTLAGYFTFASLELENPSSHKNRIMLIGPPGIGKTLTIAKLAARLAMDKRPLAVVTTDNKRAGGVEQLQAFTNILGIGLKVAGSDAELKHYLKPLPPQTHVLIDTAGCNPYQPQELEELQGFAAAGGIEPVAVMPAGGDSLEAIDMLEAFTALPVKRLLVTRTDSARRFGGVLAAAAAHNLAFANVSSSPGIADRLPPLDAPTLAQLLLRYRESLPP